MRHRPRYHDWLLAALLVALCVVVGYAFLGIPNLELFTASIFISGYLVGPVRGSIVGITAAFLFSIFNPYGAPGPALLAAQMASQALTGCAGGWIGRGNWMTFHPRIRVLLFGLAGFMLTLIYDILTTLSYALLMAGGDMRKLWATFVAGMGFYGLHLLSNTMVFALLAPVLLQRLSRIIKK